MTKTFKKALRKIVPLLSDSRKKELNEADTRNVVERFLETVLGYNLFKEISAEEAVEHRAVDYAVRIGKKIVFLVEIKSIQTKLKDNHVFQAKNYAASLGVPWCVLTNGVEYRLYHIDFSEAVKHEIVFEANVVDDDLSEAAKNLWYLSRKSMARNEAEKVWRQKKSLGEESLLECILSPRVLRAIRKQLRSQSRQRTSDADVARALKRMFSEQLYEAYERLTAKFQRKRRRSRGGKARLPATVTPAAAVPKPGTAPAA